MKMDRKILNDTLTVLFSSQKDEIRRDYLFYAHILGKCAIKLTNDLPAPAGIMFNLNHYVLYIRPYSSIVPLKDFIEKHPNVDLTKFKERDFVNVDGVDSIYAIRGFYDYTLYERMAILKHEMLHILYGHVQRKQDRQHNQWNYATDCALNQFINSSHLPTSAIMPKFFEERYGIKVNSKDTSEYYYDLIRDNEKESDKGEDGNGSCDGKGELSNEYSMDSHDTWAESKGDEDFQKSITKRMIEEARNDTVKGKGNVPGECDEWLELHSSNAQVNWRQIFRNISGNKKTSSRRTIMRKDRRMPHRPDLRGKTKDRTFNWLAVWDVSGSMSDAAGLATLAEIKHICKMTNSDANLIQVDSQAYAPEKLKKTTKSISRKGRGGTYLNTALEVAKEHNLDFQAVVVLTDGGLFDGDIDGFAALNKKVIWLIEPNGRIMDEMETGKMKAFKLDHQDE